jgi:cation transporter-like permease
VYVGISLSVGWFFSIVLRLHERFRALDRYLSADRVDNTTNEQMTRDEWALAYVKYHLDSGLRTRSVLLSPAEDGLVCVPVLLLGIGPVQAAIGGAVFGILHLGRFTRLDCAAKAIIYGLVCYYVLPHGLLTVVLGHYMTNGMAFAFMQLAERRLDAKLRSGSTMKPDARQSRVRGSP